MKLEAPNSLERRLGVVHEKLRWIIN
jgi:hypothetical protein